MSRAPCRGSSPHCTTHASNPKRWKKSRRRQNPIRDFSVRPFLYSCRRLTMKNSCLVFPLATAFKPEYLIYLFLFFPSGKAQKSFTLCWFCLFVIKLMAIFLRHSRVKFLLLVPFYLRDVTAEISSGLCCQKISSPAWEPKLPSSQNISAHQGRFWHRVSVKTPWVSEMLFFFSSDT